MLCLVTFAEMTKAEIMLKSVETLAFTPWSRIASQDFVFLFLFLVLFFLFVFVHIALEPPQKGTARETFPKHFGI